LKVPGEVTKEFPKTVKNYITGSKKAPLETTYEDICEKVSKPADYGNPF
jgi:hypothetical protein